MDHRAFVCLSLLLLGTPGAWSAETPNPPPPPAAPPAAPRIDLQQDDAKGQLRATIDGQEAFVFNYGPTVDLPHFYPLRSPTGQSMLVQHPDPYPHHRALWFADTVERAGLRTGNLYEAYYTGPGGREQPGPPFRDHVRHVQFTFGPKGERVAQLEEQLVWEIDQTIPVLDEYRQLRIAALGAGEYLLDITFRLTAAHGDLDFVSDQVHYAWPFVRMDQAFSVDRGGRLTNSAGGVNQQGTHDKPADWVDYSATVDGQTSGLTIFSHSDNPRPHLWLTRDYGTFGPRRVHAQSGQRFQLPQGQSLQQRVGILVHRGDVDEGQVARRFAAYCHGTP